MIDALIEKIHALQERYIAGDRDAGADLYGYRMQLIKALHLQRPAWRCQVCYQATRPCRYDGAICEVCDLALLANMQRHCTVCGAVKALNCFYQRPDTQTRRRVCTPCYGVQCRERYPESRAAVLAKFHERNPTYRRDKNHARYQADPDAAKARTYAWREKNRERYNETQRAWKQRQKETQ